MVFYFVKKKGEKREYKGNLFIAYQSNLKCGRESE
jgi:hypothetical protein